MKNPARAILKGVLKRPGLTWIIARKVGWFGSYVKTIVVLCSDNTFGLDTQLLTEPVN